MNPEPEGPIFLGGVGRSGTTLLSMVLHAHPQVAVSPETKYLTKWHPRCKRTGCLRDTEGRESYLKDLLWSGDVADLGFTDAELDALFTDLVNREELRHAEVLETILRRYADLAGAPRWAEKTPEHLEHFPLLHRWYPHARFVGVVRDPRDVTLSRSKVDWVDTNSVHHARHWRRYARLARSYREDPDLPFLEVRYEDLLRDPESTVARLCRFLDLPVDPAMLSHEEAVPEEEATFDAAKEPWKAKSLRPLDPSNIGKWRDELPLADVKVVEHVAGDEMSDRGYGLHEPGWSLPLAARVAARYAAYPYLKVRHDLRWVLQVKLGRGDGDDEA